VLGLEEQICHEFFEDAGRYPGTKSLINVLQDYLKMHASAYQTVQRAFRLWPLPFPQRRGAACQLAEFIRRLHAHTRKPQPEHYSAVEELGKAAGPTFLRDLLEMLPEQPVHLDDVESLESILKRSAHKPCLSAR